MKKFAVVVLVRVAVDAPNWEMAHDSARVIKDRIDESVRAAMAPDGRVDVVLDQVVEKEDR